MLQDIIINALSIIGIYAATRDGFLLDLLRKFIEITPVLNRLQKPLVNCAVCMSSIWGTIYYIYSGNKYVDLIFHIFAVAGSIYIISKFTTLMSRTYSYLDLAKLLKDDNDNDKQQTE